MKSNVMGFESTPAKKEKGARLGTPSGEMVDTEAIGRGTIPPNEQLVALLNRQLLGIELHEE